MPQHRTIVNVNFVDAFNEADHPRKGGKFTTAGGQVKSNAGAARGVQNFMKRTPLHEKVEKAAKAHEKAASLHEAASPEAGKASMKAGDLHLQTGGLTNHPDHQKSSEAKRHAMAGNHAAAAAAHREAASMVRAKVK